MRLRGEVRNPEALGRMLQQGRMLRKVSQRELAEELGLTQKQVWKIESGIQNRLVDQLFEMMRATGCHMYMELDADDSNHD